MSPAYLYAQAYKQHYHFLTMLRDLYKSWSSSRYEDYVNVLQCSLHANNTAHLQIHLPSSSLNIYTRDLKQKVWFNKLYILCNYRCFVWCVFFKAIKIMALRIVRCTYTEFILHRQMSVRTLLPNFIKIRNVGKPERNTTYRTLEFMGEYLCEIGCWVWIWTDSEQDPVPGFCTKN